MCIVREQTLLLAFGDCQTGKITEQVNGSGHVLPMLLQVSSRLNKQTNCVSVESSTVPLAVGLHIKDFSNASERTCPKL